MLILNTFRIFRRYEARMRERLGDGFDLAYRDQEDESAILDLLPEANILISNRFTKEYAPRCRRPGLLHTPGAGLDKIDVAAVPAGVRLCQSFGHGASIAEYVLMAAVALYRRLLQVDRALREGRWMAPQADPAEGLLEPLTGKTIAILGTGEIGKAVAAGSRAFGMKTIGINLSGSSPGGSFDEVHPVSGMTGILRVADILVVAIPLEAATQGLIGARELALLKPAAILINVARGPVVDEEALYRALSERRLAGAAVDVWYDYPPPGSNIRMPSRYPFGELDNVIMTPHISGVARSTFDRRVEDLLFNIEAFAAGRPLLHEVRLAESRHEDHRR